MLVKSAFWITLVCTFRWKRDTFFYYVLFLLDSWRNHCPQNRVLLLETFSPSQWLHLLQLLQVKMLRNYVELIIFHPLLTSSNHLVTWLKERVSPLGSHIFEFNNTHTWIVTARDWQGTPIPLENFNIRFKPINKLDEPNHRAVMKLVQDEVKQKGEQYEGLVEEIRSRQDVTDEYLNSMLWHILYSMTRPLNSFFHQSSFGHFDTLVC